MILKSKFKKTRMDDDFHAILSDVYKNVFFSNEAPTVINYPYLKKFRDRTILSYLSMGLSNFIVAAKVFLNANSNYIVIREFSNIPMAFFSLFMLPFRKKLYFNINHNINDIRNGLPFSIKFICFLGFRFILFDGSLLSSRLGRYQTSFCFPLFPLRNSFYSCFLKKNTFEANGLFKIGVLASSRIEKSMENIKELLSSLRDINGVQMFVGCRSPEVFSNYDNMGYHVFLTNTETEYQKFLSRLDAIILFAKADNYYSRHSGTIMDAISYGVIPIVPNFPVFFSQVNLPVTVGCVYDDPSELFSVIADLSNNAVKFQENFPNYWQSRTSVEV